MSTSHYRSDTQVLTEGFGSVAMRDRRRRLVNRFNQLTGVPSYSVTRLQEEFIEDKLAPDEMVGFAEMCSNLIQAAEQQLG